MGLAKYIAILKKNLSGETQIPQPAAKNATTYFRSENIPMLEWHSQSQDRHSDWEFVEQSE